MSPYLSLPLTSWAAVAFVMILVWIWAYRIKNAGIVDIFWAYNFLVIAGVIYFFTGAHESNSLLNTGSTDSSMPGWHTTIYPLLFSRLNVVCLLAALWSLRLGTYLLIRVGSHLSAEEGRYKQLREEWAPNANLKFFIFFQMQALSNVFLALPFFIIALNPEPYFSWLECTGATIWFIAIIGEGLSDWQLARFKKDPANKGKVCQSGFWNYSRHPNYFFQLLLWIGVAIFALESPYGWIGLICPVTIAYLIFKVTGIPMTEEQALRSKGEAYREYQRTTSVFIPLPKKH
jgi:steroid 5-alpha reductase family enzyme